MGQHNWMERAASLPHCPTMSIQHEDFVQTVQDNAEQAEENRTKCLEIAQETKKDAFLSSKMIYRLLSQQHELCSNTSQPSNAKWSDQCPQQLCCQYHPACTSTFSKDLHVHSNSGGHQIVCFSNSWHTSPVTHFSQDILPALLQATRVEVGAQKRCVGDASICR